MPSKLEMLNEIDREIFMRERVYPKRVAEGKMKQITATKQIETMKAVRRIVEAFDDGERLGRPHLTR